MSVAADPFGYRDAFEAAVEHCLGRRIWAVEGTGSYGAGLAAYLERQGEWVVEIDHPTRRRGGGKSDALDAVRAAREALARDWLTVPRARGERSAIRSFLVRRRSSARRRSWPATSWSWALCLPAAAALLVGLDERLRVETGLSVRVAESPLTCVVIGAGHSLQELAVIGKSAGAQARRSQRFLR